MRITLLTLVLAFIVVSGSAHAAAIGQLEKEHVESEHAETEQAGKERAEFGYLLGAGVMTLDDPDGATGAEFVLQPFALVYTARIRGSWRHWLELYYQQATFDASLGRIGEEMTRFGMRLSLQKYLMIAAGFTPRIGAGFDISRSNYANRYTVDSDGFLAGRFADRSGTDVNVLVNVLNEWAWSKNRSVHAKLEYLSPIGGEVSSLSASLAFLFRY